MIFIIDCKKYDTSKSEIIFNQNYATTSETIYKTQKGNYFIVKTDLFYKESKAKTMKEEKVKKYIFKNFPSRYEEIFGEIEEG